MSAVPLKDAWVVYRRDWKGKKVFSSLDDESRSVMRATLYTKEMANTNGRAWCSYAKPFTHFLRRCKPGTAGHALLELIDRQSPRPTLIDPELIPYEVGS